MQTALQSSLPRTRPSLRVGHHSKPCCCCCCCSAGVKQTPKRALSTLLPAKLAVWRFNSLILLLLCCRDSGQVSGGHLRRHPRLRAAVRLAGLHNASGLTSLWLLGKQRSSEGEAVVLPRLVPVEDASLP